MDAAKKEDILLLADEKFDFDLSLSSSSANEDDEVFFGPVGHKERCIVASLELSHPLPEQPRAPGSGSPCTWSPLSGEKFVEVYKEAHLLALQIESQSRREAAQAAEPGNPWNQGVEDFLQDPKLKMKLFEREQGAEKSPATLKRETFCLLGNPRGVPLLSVQPPPPLAFPPALPSAPAPAGPAPPQDGQGLPHSSQPLPEESGPSHPPTQGGAQKRIPSKLQPPRALPVRRTHASLAVEKLRKEVPAGVPRMKPLSEKEPRRAVPPNKPGAAPDPSRLPARGNRPGKRCLPIPNKSGLKKTFLKPPGGAGSGPGRSSSESRVSSSTGVSPPAGKAKSSELASIPANSSRALSGTCKLGRVGPTALRQALPPAPTSASCRQARRASADQTTAEQPKAPATAPLAPPQTPECRGPRLDPDSVSSTFSQLNKTGSIRRDSCLNSKTEVASTPTNPFKVPQFSVGESPEHATPKFSQAQRPQSWTSAGRVHSTPVRRSTGPAFQGLPGSMRTPMSTRRMSALPTPAGRRLSGLPLVTPQSTPRALVSPLCVPARRLSSEPRKRSAVRAEPMQESGSTAGDGQVGQGLSSDESASPPSSVPQVLNFSPEKSDFPGSQGCTAGAAQEQAEPREDPHPSEALLIDIRLEQLTITPEAEGRALADHPLIDFGSTPEASVAVRPSSRPLIDLMMNTPDMERSGVGQPVKAELGQLIDLGSPLIQLSPEADKENVDSPLLKF